MSLILFCHLQLCLQNGLFLSAFPYQNVVYILFAPIRATCPGHRILLDSIMPMICGDECGVWSFRVQFFQPPVIILLGAAVLKHCRQCERSGFMPTQNRFNCVYVCKLKKLRPRNPLGHRTSPFQQSHCIPLPVGVIFTSLLFLFSIIGRTAFRNPQPSLKDSARLVYSVLN
jgi:hypothetical protein